MNYQEAKKICSGFPAMRFRAEVQFTVKNSDLCRALGRNDDPFYLDIDSIEERGLVLGLIGKKGHKMLYEWDKIVDIFPI